ncbi:hypothetical protein PENTCL1PPCAC_16313, partial [Pristionchus entomophagus]
MVNCLVCGKYTSTLHMGMDACRACSVFYRRNHELLGLFCITGSGACRRKNKSIFSCRKCRLDRIEAMMRAGSGDDVMLPMPSFTTNSYANVGSTYYDRMINTPPRTPRISIIDRIRVNLRTLSAVRCTRELKLRGIQSLSMRKMEDEYPIVPSTRQFLEETTKILISGLFEFVSATFPDFEQLSLDDKWLLIRNYEKLFHCIDGKLRVRRRFGKDSSILFGTYTTAIFADFVDYFFSDCEDKRNATEAANTFRGWLKENGPRVKKEIDRVDPSDDEFLAMIGLALWNLENVDASDHLLSLAARYRTEIMEELTDEYGRTVGVEKGTSRIGILMCLLQEFRRVVMSLQSNHALYIMLGAIGELSLV